MKTEVDWLWADFRGGDKYLKQADRLMTKIEKHQKKFVEGGDYFHAKVREVQRLLGTEKL